jgi:uridine phosphorylase
MNGSYLTDRYLRLPDGSFPHLGIRGDGDVAAVAVVSGSPERVELMASMMEGAERVGDRRGYAVYTGTYRESRISVATSGVGSPSLAIAVEELGACGVRTFIRAGSCASIDERLRIGDVAIAHGAVRDEGTSPYYAPMNYPAIGSPRVLRALIDCAADLDVDVAVGLTRSTDSFYEGERKAEIIERWSSLGVLTFEMETSALFTVAGAMGWEAGSLLVAGSNLLTSEATYRGNRIEEYGRGQDRMLDVALGAAATLAGGAE